MADFEQQKQSILEHVTIQSIASRYSAIKKSGKGYVTICPAHDDHKPSLTIYTGKQGHERCKCFVCKFDSDVIGYYQEVTGSSYRDTLEHLSTGLLIGASDKPLTEKTKPIKPATWQASKPPSGNTPASFVHYEYGSPTATWCYRDADGEVLYYECRYLRTDQDTGETKKEPRCWTWGRMSEHLVYKWSCKHWHAPRPPYGLDSLAKYKRGTPKCQVVLFEGPRKADKAQSLIAAPCMSWAAGAGNWHHTDWTPIAGHPVILFPDNDLPGRKAMCALAQHLIKQGCTVEMVNIPESKPTKWDICDEPNLDSTTLKALLKNRTKIEAIDMTVSISSLPTTSRTYTLNKALVSDFAADPYTDDATPAYAAPDETLPATDYAGMIAGWTEPAESLPDTDGDWDDTVPPEGDVDMPQVVPEQASPPQVSPPQAHVVNIKPSFNPLMIERQEWPEPDNLLADGEQTRIDRAYLPDIIGNLAFCKSGPTGSDPGALAMSMLAITASAIDDRIQLYPDRHGSWPEQARIWVALVGSPSAKKTFCVDYAAKPLKAADDLMAEKSDHEKRKYKALMKKYDALMSEWLETDQSTPPPIPPKHPEVPRYYMSNATIEAFGDIMQYNPRGTCIVYDELSGWIGGMGQFKQSGGSDRADWLMAYNGGPQRIDRITRGNVRVNNFSACCVGGIQPDVLLKVARNTAEDGLLQRFYVAFVPESEPGNPPTLAQAEQINKAEARYRAMINHMLAMVADGARVEMSDGARASTLQAFRQFHKLSSLQTFGSKASAAITKFEGGLHRMCLIYHCIECFERSVHPASAEVSEHTAKMVVELFKQYILPNIVAFYGGVLGESSVFATDIRRTANFILAKQLETITVSDLRNYGGLKNKSSGERREVIAHLIEAGWLEPTGHYSHGGSPRVYLVNPRVHAKYTSAAAKERKRIADTIQAMAACNVRPGQPGQAGGTILTTTAHVA